ncbi:MAG: response regulator [Proteobacteria bacterium]|nr:response regulator [Pseudomonadota bacterium]
MNTLKILVVDDEPKIRRIISSYLVEDGFDVAEAEDGETALRLAKSDPDLVVLDVKLPGIDGIEVLRQLRMKSNVPVILLTAQAEETDRLIGLSVGADDYVTKPFSPRELVLRIKAVLRRTTQASSPDGSALEFEDLTIDPGSRVVTVDGNEPELTALEFDLLATLAGTPGNVLSRRQLLDQVWGWDFVGDERVVDVHIRNLRSKMGDDAESPRFVATVRGVGYKFIGERP